VHALAQPANTDSLRNVIRSAASVEDRARAAIALGAALRMRNPDSAAVYFERALALAEASSNDSLEFAACQRLALIKGIQGDEQAAIAYTRKAIAHGLDANVGDEVLRLYANLGKKLLDLQGDFDSATYYLQLSINGYRKTRDAFNIWYPLHILGMAHADLGDWSDSKSYFMQALDAIRTNPASSDYAYLLYVTMDFAERMNDLPFYATTREAYLVNRKNKGKPILDANHSFLKGVNETPAEVRQRTRKFLPVHLKQKEPFGACESYYVIGNTYLAEANYDKALSAFDSMKIFVDELAVPMLSYNYHDAVLRVHRAAGRAALALPHADTLLALRDSILNMEKQTLAQELNIKYQTAEKEKTLAEQTLLLDRVQNRQRLLTVGLISVSAILLLTILALQAKRRYSRNLEEKNRIIDEALTEKDTLLREIHHRVKNNLQMISALLYLHGKSAEDASAQAALMESQNRVQSMAMIHQDLYMGKNLLGVSVPSYLDKLLDHLINAYNIDRSRITIHKDIRIENLDVDTVIPLALIINELLSNALKHAFAGPASGEIGIHLYQHAGDLVLEVRDSGKGMPPGFDPSSSSNFGFKLVRILAERLGAELSVRSDQGTLISLTTPLPRAA
jgi:two-component sensor histidine kinase